MNIAPRLVTFIVLAGNTDGHTSALESSIDRTNPLGYAGQKK